MKTVPCDFPTIRSIGNRCYAEMTRTGKHPILGYQKEGQITRTSEIRVIDFERGYMITQNTMYYWKVGE